MFKLKNGYLRTVVYNQNDLDLYKQAGWTMVEEPKEKDTPKKEINEQNNAKSKSDQK